MDEGDFRTLKGYARQKGPGLTAAMEDYLEMICRCAGEEGFVRVRQLAHRLHVSPSSASKMAELLRRRQEARKGSDTRFPSHVLSSFYVNFFRNRQLLTVLLPSGKVNAFAGLFPNFT